MNYVVPRTNKQQVKQAIRDKFAWPGGYPLFLVTADGAVLCVDCGRKQFRHIAWDWTRKQSTGWCAEGAVVNLEDTELSCDHCGNNIDSAYGEKEDDNGKKAD